MIAETDQRIPEFKKLLESIFEENADLSQIFLSKTALNIISNRYFSSWHTLLEKGVELSFLSSKKMMKRVLNFLPIFHSLNSRSFWKRFLFKQQKNLIPPKELIIKFLSLNSNEKIFI